MKARATVPAGDGVITGTVLLTGEAPQMRVIPNSACHPGAPAALDESVVVGENGAMKNVIVYLDQGPPADLPAGTAVVVLDQANCRYEPHVVAIRTGQTLRVRSNDPTLHNVHGLCERNPPFNFGMSAAGQTRNLSFAAQETFAVKCDVHPWMSGHVAVFDHPYFAVTSDDGRFEIKNVPPGKYTLVAWHERYGTLRQNVTLGPAGPAMAAKLDFSYGSVK